MGVLLYGVKFRPDCDERVNLHDLLCVHSLTHLGPETARIGPPSLLAQWMMERIIGILSSLIKQPSNPFANLTEQALPNEVQALDLPLIIKKFKFEDPLKKEFVGKEELLARDLVLVYNLDADN